MIRRYGSHGLRPQRKYEEDINPMDGVGNMADTMLVLAVGIMLALVINWNVDLKLPDSIVEMDKAQQVNEEDIDKEKVSEQAAEQGFSEMGTVYKDPETGKMYMITKEDQKNGSSSE